MKTMKHLDQGHLLAYIDRQATLAEQQQISAHLNACQQCQTDLQALQEERQLTGNALSSLAPDSLENPNKNAALRQMQSALRKETKPSMLNQFWNNPTFKRVAYSLGGVALIAGLLAFPSVRAFASNVLSIFRVEGFEVVDVDPDRIEEIVEAVDEDMDFGEHEVIQQGEVTIVEAPAEAADLAGYQPRSLTGYGDPNSVYVTGQSVMVYRPNVVALRELFSALGLDPELLPEDIDGQPFTITMPDSISMSYQDGTLQLMQLPSPTIDAPEGVDMQQLGEAMLQLLGMPPDEAAAVSASIDWTTTLVLPVPTGFGTTREVTVDGTSGILFESSMFAEYDEEALEVQMLLWQKNGMIYLIGLAGSDETALLDAADSLR